MSLLCVKGPSICDETWVPGVSFPPLLPQLGAHDPWSWEKGADKKSLAVRCRQFFPDSKYDELYSQVQTKTRIISREEQVETLGTKRTRLRGNW